MKDTNHYLDALASLNVSQGRSRSDYAVAKLLKIKPQRVSHYRTRKGGFDDALAIRAAQILGLPVGEVLANIHAARAQDDSVRAAWEQIATECRATAG